MGLIQKLLNNDYSLSMIKKFIMMVLGLITSALTVRALGLNLRGQQTYILNMENMLMLVLGLGIHNSYSVLRKKGHNVDELKRKYFNFCSTLFILYLLISVFALLFFPEELLPLVFLLTTFNIFAGQLGNIYMIENFKGHGILYTLNTVFNLGIVAIVYFVFPQNLIAVLSTYVLTYIFIIIGCMYALHIIPNPFAIDLAFAKKMICLGFVPMMIGLLNVMNYNFDTVMLKGMSVSYEEIGLYSIGTTLAGYLWLLPDVFKDISFSRSAKGNAVESICFSLRISNSITILLMLLILIFGKFIIFILYGGEYVPAYQVTLLILLGVPALGIYKIISPIYISDSRSQIVFLSLLVSVVTNIILNFIFISYYSIMGAAVASLISYSICGLYILFDFKQRYQLQYRNLFILNKSDINQISRFIFKA